MCPFVLIADLFKLNFFTGNCFDWNGVFYGEHSRIFEFSEAPPLSWGTSINCIKKTGEQGQEKFERSLLKEKNVYTEGGSKNVWRNLRMSPSSTTLVKNLDFLWKTVVKIFFSPKKNSCYTSNPNSPRKSPRTFYNLSNTEYLIRQQYNFSNVYPVDL